MGNSISNSIDAATRLDPLSMEALIEWGDEFKESHAKNIGILRGLSGITSFISSSSIIWMITRSHKGLSTTQHRLLFGLCVFDIISSINQSWFNVMAPSDNDYFMWNARGNEATCDAQGFLLILGLYGGLFYNASLNLYYLAVVKYRKKENFMEPLLHCVPIVGSVIVSITRLVGKHYNDNGFGVCISAYHYPRHCYGYEVGEIREGFEIPCGRGIKGAEIVFYSPLVLMSIPAVIMIVSLGMIYAHVRKLEMKSSRYGRGALLSYQNATPQQQQKQQQQQQQHDSQTKRPNLVSRIRVSLSNFAVPLTLNRSLSRSNDPVARSSSANRESKKSRAVMYKALGYTFAWFISFGVFIIATVVCLIVGKYPLELVYTNTIFGPLQGFFNLVIYMHPKVIKERQPRQRGGDKVPWRKAVVKAFWSRGRKEGPRRIPNCSGHSNTRHRTPRNSRLRPPQEEEKCEIKPIPNLIPQNDNGSKKSTFIMYAPVTNGEPSTTSDPEVANLEDDKNRDDEGTPTSDETKEGEPSRTIDPNKNRDDEGTPSSDVPNVFPISFKEDGNDPVAPTVLAERCEEEEGDTAVSPCNCAPDAASVDKKEAFLEVLHVDED